MAEQDLTPEPDSSPAPKRRRANWKVTTAIISSFVVGMAGIPTAQAAMAVIDKAALAKLTEQFNNMKQQLKTALDQLKTLKEQLDFLQEVSQTVNDTFDAIGEIGSITLPLLNLDKLTNGLIRDAQCLAPDLNRLMPDIDFEDVDFGSLCAVSDVYRKAILLGQENVRDLTNHERIQLARRVQARRDALLADAVTDALAQADVTTRSLEDQQAASNEARSNASSAQTLQQRMTTVAQGQVAMMQIQMETNKLLAAQLRLQAAFVAKMGLDVNSVVADIPGDPNAETEE